MMYDLKPQARRPAPYQPVVLLAVGSVITRLLKIVLGIGGVWAGISLWRQNQAQQGSGAISRQHPADDARGIIGRITLA